MNDIQIKMAVQSAAHLAHNVFTDECQSTQDVEWLDVEGLGIAISKWSEWDGVKVMRVFRAALEDANYNTEAALVEDMIARAEGEE